jgi:GNAT superfamily N-acetyltransferase
MIRRATLADLNKIIEMTIPYHFEAGVNKGRALCYERILQTFYHCITDENRLTLIDDGVTAILTMYKNYSFYDTPEADIDFFYVSPQNRGKGTARDLVESAINSARDWGVVVLHCGCHSYMADGGKNNSLFSNLFKKYGFKETGTNLHMEL